MKKTGQLMAHPFTAILTLVVAALIIFFGIAVIRDLLALGSSVDTAALTNTLQKEVNTYYTLDQGSQKSISLQVPREIAYICFVDQSTGIDYSKIPNDKAALVQAISNKNTFFIPYQGKETPDPANIQNIKPATNPLCIKTIGRLEARLVSKGTHVEISQ